MAAAAANGMTRITLSFLLSLLSNNKIGPQVPANSKPHWSYKGPDGPSNWPLLYEQCGGKRQSPIDIETGNTVYNPRLGNFHLTNFETYSHNDGPTMLNVTNNGHAASVRVTSSMRVTGGGLNGTYKTAEFHFHWGSSNDVGSEHALDGRKFPLEMHVVNFAEKYGTIKNAMTEPDGLAVLGVFFELSDKDNPAFSPLDDALRYVHKAGTHNLVDQLRLRALLPDDITRYWRYNGSLTTPYCFETVTWTVFATPQKISRSQLKTLRSLLHEQGHDKRLDPNNLKPSRLVDNWRPLQPLNGRTVYRSFDETHNIRSPAVPSELSPERSANTIVISTGNSEQTVGDNIATVEVAPTPTFGVMSNGIIQSLSSSSSSSNDKVNADSISESNKNINEIDQLKEQRRLLELQKQQQEQKLKQLLEQQQKLEELHQQQQLLIQQQSSESQTLFGENNVVPNNNNNNNNRLVSHGNMRDRNTARSLGKDVRIINDGTLSREPSGVGPLDESNSANLPSNKESPMRFQEMKLQPSLNPTSTSISASQDQNQRYVKPLDPNFKFSFPMNGGFSQNGQKSRLQQFQVQKHNHPRIQNDQPSVTFIDLNHRLQSQRFQPQHADLKNSLFSHLRSPQFQRQNSGQVSGFRQSPFRSLSNQQQQIQPQARQRTMVSQQQQAYRLQQQQQQQPPARTHNLTVNQLRSLLGKLVTPNRQQPGTPQTLISPASRMVPSPSGVNGVIRGNAAGRRSVVSPVNNARKIYRGNVALRLTNQANQTPPTITSGRNPIPYSSNQRQQQRVASQISPSPQNIQFPSSSLPASSSLSSSSSLAPLNSSPPFLSSQHKLHFRNQPAYQFRNRPSSNYGGPGQNNWFYSDMNAQHQNEELPYVFLHRIQKPVRIRRPFYERLYNIKY